MNDCERLAIQTARAVGTEANSPVTELLRRGPHHRPGGETALYYYARPHHSAMQCITIRQTESSAQARPASGADLHGLSLTIKDSSRAHSCCCCCCHRRSSLPQTEGIAPRRSDLLSSFPDRLLSPSRLELPRIFLRRETSWRCLVYGRPVMFV